MPKRIAPKRPVRVYLAEWREHLRLTQQEIGERIGDVDKGTVSRWETAKRAPSLDVLAAYAEALRVPVGFLYRRPNLGPSLDDMVADAPEELQRKAAEMIGILLRQG
jgi:transcriptional regulator with XRE-family HTH domain